MMAFANSTSERMDELRLRNQTSSRNDSALLGLVSPPRNGTRLPPPTQPQDARVNLTRRFTTDSGRVPTLTSIANPTQRGPEGQEYNSSVRTPYCFARNRNIYSSPLINSHCFISLFMNQRQYSSLTIRFHRTTIKSSS